MNAVERCLADLPRHKDSEGNVRLAIAPSELRDVYTTHGTKLQYTTKHEQLWWGTPEEVEKLLAEGDPRVVAGAKQLKSKVEAKLAPVLASARQLVDSAYGGALCTPAHLAGSPTPFKRVVPVDRSLGVRVFVGLGGVAAMSTDSWLNRGLGIIALTQTLQRIYPTELVGFTTDPLDFERSRFAVITCPMSTGVADWSMASCVITSGPVYRRVLLAAEEALSKAAGFGYLSVESDPQALRKALKAKNTDLIIPEGYRGPDADLLVTDPAEWVAARVREFVAGA